MRYQAYFFDFDGVIVDSVHIKSKAFAELFQNYGEEIQKKIIEHHLSHGGMTRAEKIQFYFEQFIHQKISVQQLRRQCDIFSSIVEKQVISAPEIPGVQQFIKDVSRKTKCFIVSATPDDELNRIVQKRELGKYFIEILGSNRSKTANLLYLLKKYEFTVSRCKFFGDALSDFEAASLYSIPFVGIIPDTDAPLYKKVPDILWCPDFYHKNVKL